MSEFADIVGIDFGTSYTRLSVANGDTVRVIGDADDQDLYPSIVHYPEEGVPYSGWSAREKLIRQPQRTVASPKRLLGQAFTDPQAAGYLQSLPFNSSRAPDGSVILEIKGQQVPIIQVCTALLSDIRKFGEAVNVPVNRAVFSVPVTFEEPQRTAIRRAAQLAKIEPVALIDEPVAAAMAYGFGKNKSEIVAVYDFGGGTFDFTVINIEGYSFEVLARGGDQWLGGDDFDMSLATSFANAIWRATNVEVRDRAVEWRRLLFACEEAKRELSRVDQTVVSVDRILEYPRVVNLNQPLTRAQLNEFCNDHVTRSIAICKSVLERASLEPEDIDQLVVSGGISRVPLVRTAVEEFFKRPITHAVDPARAICLGAGLRAAQLSKHPVKGTGPMITPKKP